MREKPKMDTDTVILKMDTALIRYKVNESLVTKKGVAIDKKVYNLVEDVAFDRLNCVLNTAKNVSNKPGNKITSKDVKFAINEGMCDKLYENVCKSCPSDAKEIPSAKPYELKTKVKKPKTAGKDIISSYQIRKYTNANYDVLGKDNKLKVNTGTKKNPKFKVDDNSVPNLLRKDINNTIDLLVGSSRRINREGLGRTGLARENAQKENKDYFVKFTPEDVLVARSKPLKHGKKI